MFPLPWMTGSQSKKFLKKVIRSNWKVGKHSQSSCNVILQTVQIVYHMTHCFSNSTWHNFGSHVRATYIVCTFTAPRFSFCSKTGMVTDLFLSETRKTPVKCKGKWYWLVIATTQLRDQHSCGDFTMITPVDDLSENAAWRSHWMARELIIRWKNRWMIVDHEKPNRSDLTRNNKRTFCLF